MKFLILLALLTLAVTAFYQIPLKRTESSMAKMMKAGTWNDRIMKKNVFRALAHKTHKKYTQEVTDYDDAEYYANISIGTPGQWFRTTPDTTSAFLWVPDKTCKDELDPSLQYGPRSKSANEENAEHVSLDRKASGCKGKNKFDQTKSSTYLINGIEFETSFGEIPNPLKAYGFLGKDTFRLNEIQPQLLIVPNVTFGQAKGISSAFSELPFDGILGLAFPALSPSHTLSPFFEAVNQGLLDKPIFTVFLDFIEDNIDEDGGLFTYGGLDDINCGPVLAYEELTSATYYQFKLESVQYGSYTSYQKWQAISDTSTAFIYAPYFVVQSIAKESKAEFSDTYKCYVVNCKAEFPDIKLGIGAEIYNIQYEYFVFRIHGVPGKCCLRILYSAGTGYIPDWILGYPFHWSYCTVYNVKEKQIGFALPIEE